MNRSLGRFPLSVTAVVPALIMVFSLTIAVVRPDAMVRRCGWSGSIFALMLVFIALARVVWLAFEELRIQVITKVAESRLDEEWQRLDKR